jgi:hypothetical protein
MPVIGILNSRSADDSAPNIAAFRQGLKETGFYTGRILKALSLPICRSNNQLNSSWRINLKTAKALGLEVPATLLARADEVVEQAEIFCCTAYVGSWH